VLYQEEYRKAAQNVASSIGAMPQPAEVASILESLAVSA
jgi:hypothetical protein